MEPTKYLFLKAYVFPIKSKMQMNFIVNSMMSFDRINPKIMNLFIWPNI